MFYAGGASQGVCPADMHAHDGSQSAHYASVLGDDAQGQQGGWKWCAKCQGMFYAKNDITQPGGTVLSVCPQDNFPHDGRQSAHYAAVFGSGAEGQQVGWRWCKKCQGMFYAGGSSHGVCPVDKHAHDGTHSASYVAVLGDAGVAHNGSASGSYAMPWDISDVEHFHDNIVFPTGIALGGWYDLVITSHGDISYSGALHDSGLDSYNGSISVVLMTPDGIAYSVTHNGKTHGTLEAGSRDDNWADNTQSPLIAANWDNQFALATARMAGNAGSVIFGGIEKLLVDTANQMAAELGKAAVTAVVALI